MRLPKINNGEIAKMLEAYTKASSSYNLRIRICEYDFDEEKDKI